MATEVTRVIDPDMGSGYNYDSLVDWEADRQRDLVSADEIEVAKCRSTGGSADTSGVDIDGWTTDSTRYCKVWCDPSDTGGDGRGGSYAHEGVWPSSGKIYRCSGRIYCNEYVHIENIAIKHSMNAGPYAGALAVGAGGVLTAKRCYLENTGTGAALTVYDAPAAQYLYNCILVIAGGYNHVWCSVAYTYTVYGVYFYNCTAISKGQAFAAYIAVYSKRSVTCYNCIGVLASIFSGGGVYLGYSSGGVYGDYTTASDSTYPSGASNYWTSAIPSFVDATNKDYHLASSDTVAKDKGYNYSSAGYSDDIDGETRSGTWDIGADELNSSLPPQLLTPQRSVQHMLVR